MESQKQPSKESKKEEGSGEAKHNIKTPQNQRETEEYREHSDIQDLVQNRLLSERRFERERNQLSRQTTDSCNQEENKVYQLIVDKVLETERLKQMKENDGDSPQLTSQNQREIEAQEKDHGVRQAGGNIARQILQQKDQVDKGPQNMQIEFRNDCNGVTYPPPGDGSSEGTSEHTNSSSSEQFVVPKNDFIVAIDDSYAFGSLPSMQPPTQESLRMTTSRLPPPALNFAYSLNNRDDNDDIRGIKRNRDC